MCRSQNRPATLLLGSILIVHEQTKDLNNKDKNFKGKIYQLVLKTKLQHMYAIYYI